MTLPKTIKNKSIYAETNTHWSDTQKTEAIQSWLLLGNLALTARVLGIPEITLRKWKAQPWWRDQAHELRSQERMELSTRLKKIVNASLTVVEDRLLNGDFVFDQKAGEVMRRPVAMKDAHKVAVDLQDRAEVMEAVDKPVQTDDHIEDKLLRLAEKFAEMATKKIQQKQDEVRTVDVEDA